MELDDYELESIIEALRSEVRDCARRIRHCLECDQGYISRPYSHDPRYTCAEPCDCLLAYRKAGKELAYKLRAYEKKNKYEYPNAVTSEMTWLVKPTEHPCTPERMAYWRQRFEAAIQGFGVTFTARDLRDEEAF